MMIKIIKNEIIEAGDSDNKQGNELSVILITVLRHETKHELKVLHYLVNKLTIEKHKGSLF